MLSCSFSSSRCSSAAVSGLGCRIGACACPCDEGERSIIACGGRGELGRLLLFGTGGGPIIDDTRLPWSEVSCCGDMVFALDADTVLEARPDANEFKSGAIPLLFAWKLRCAQ